MLKIVTVANGENLNNEHISFEVEIDCDIGNYVLINGTYDSEEATANKRQRAYFFPQKDVKKGDFVVLWTKPGMEKHGKTAWGAPKHNFFWGLLETVWNSEGDRALVLYAPRPMRTHITVSAWTDFHS